ncbi:hypothetical protein GH733_012840 [Mirounga leonina]|nr:hypothetical protein GH733_012840 [Mirounga leonina]
MGLEVSPADSRGSTWPGEELKTLGEGRCCCEGEQGRLPFPHPPIHRCGMWPFLSHTLFPPPTEAWLQSVSPDPEALGWGAWSRAEKPPLGPGKLEAIKLKLWAMEQAQGPETQGRRAKPRRRRAQAPPPTCGETHPGAPLSVGCPCPGSPVEKVESDHRSVYVGNSEASAGGPPPPGAYLWQVDCGGTAEHLESYFNPCGEGHQVTVPCDKFSGHPKGSVPARQQGAGGGGLREGGSRGARRPGVLWSPGIPGWPSPALPAYPSYAYMEFAAKSSAQAAVELDESIFRGRVLKRDPAFGPGPKGPTCQGSAPRTAGAWKDIKAPEEDPSPTAVSGAGPASDHEGGTGGRGPPGPRAVRNCQVHPEEEASGTAHSILGKPEATYEPSQSSLAL